MIFTWEVLDQILFYAQENGLGADRSQGFGQFTYKLTKK
jgi:CRISPR/Cas system CSM-associated protein Csm4 (group 5 of RAMP superfamily)